MQIFPLACWEFLLFTKVVSRLCRIIIVCFVAVLIVLFGLLSEARQVSASSGDLLRSIFVNPIPSCSYFSAGVAFDGSELLISCVFSNVITRVSPLDGRNLGTLTIDGISASEGIAAMSWDAQNGRLWVGSATVVPQKIYTVTLDKVGQRGTATFQFAHTQTGGESWLDGLAFDPTDGTIWLGPDGQTKVYNYSQTGALLGSFDVAAWIGAPGKSGLVVGSPTKLYVANNGGSKIFSVNKDGISPTLFATVPANKRVEDLECDSVTFAPKSVIWSQYSFDNYELDAFEVPEGECLTAKTPLILIPGIGGSELKTSETVSWSQSDGHGGTFTNVYPAEEKVWVNNFQAGLPGEDDYFDVLRMAEDGQTSEANLTLTGNLFEAYQETIDFFVSDGYVLNEDLFVFPYDWRKDISLTALLLNQKIESIKEQTGSAKVDIIAHSMGGLVARNYIADLAKAQNVRKLFTLGTPHLGSVKFLKAIRYGICLKFEIGPACLSIAPSEIKDVLQNMISGYELSPSQSYFNFYSGENNDHPYPFADIRDVDGNGITGKLNYSQIKTLLTNLGHNTGLFGPSEALHSLDNDLTNTNGVEVTNIVGSGMSTLGQIIEKYSIDFLGIKIPYRDEISVNGDQTVPLFSASLIDSGRNKSLLGDAKVFYTEQEHGNLVSSGPALNLLKNILNNDSQLPDGVSITSYSFSGTGISVHSPVDLHAYDAFGNHTGPTVDGDFEENISGSSYDTLDDAKFIFLPDDGNYNIKFEATDQGSFDFKIRKYENDTISEETLYKDIPLKTSTKAEAQLDTSSSQSPIIQLDEDGNGTVDQNIDPTANLTGNAVYDQTPPQTTISLDGTKGNNDWYTSDVKVTLQANDETSGSGINKIEYSLDNGQSVQAYTQPFTVSQEGITKIKFRSIDNAGNEEDPKEAEIKVDKTPPEVAIDANPKILWPANNKMVDVEITGSSQDANIYSIKITVEDEYRLIEPAITDFGQIIQLQASRNGDDLDGRVYTIKAVAEDLAGNTAQALVEVIVPHDQRK